MAVALKVEGNTDAPPPPQADVKQEASTPAGGGNGNNGQGPPPPAPAASAQQPAPSPMGMNMGGMAPGPAMGMGYHGGYQMPPGGYGYPSQPPPMMPPMHMGGGGHMMMPPAHSPYGGMPGGMGMPPPMQPPLLSVGGGDKQKASGTQVCVVHPPGMPRAFEVPFPERRLPVCDRCKKNYRSRELCRQRDGHRALPWQTTYVVITLADEVLEKAADGVTLTYADVPVTAELMETPEMCRGPADGCMAREPICKVCKEKNYTRDHCRNTLRHTTPPYQCVYVRLVLNRHGDTSGIDGGGDRMRPSKRKKKRQEENADGKARPDLDTAEGGEAGGDGEDDAEGGGEGEGGGNNQGPGKSDDLNDIHTSKTFFATISSKNITVKWCEQIRFPEQSEPPAQHQHQQAGPPGPFSMPPFMPGMPFGHSPSMQQQMWDAFRAGAMWAQSQAAANPHGQGGQVQMPPGFGHARYAPPNGGGGSKDPNMV